MIFHVNLKVSLLRSNLKIMMLLVIVGTLAPPRTLSHRDCNMQWLPDEAALHGAQHERAWMIRECHLCSLWRGVIQHGLLDGMST